MDDRFSSLLLLCQAIPEALVPAQSTSSKNFLIPELFPAGQSEIASFSTSTDVSDSFTCRTDSSFGTNSLNSARTDYSSTPRGDNASSTSSSSLFHSRLMEEYIGASFDAEDLAHRITYNMPNLVDVDMASDLLNSQLASQSGRLRPPPPEASPGLSAEERLQKGPVKRKLKRETGGKISCKASRRMGAGSVLSLIFSSFNSGDVDKLQEVIHHFTQDNCSFQTSSLPSRLEGRQHINMFFQALLESHPDAYLISVDERFIDENTLSASIRFKGTRVIASAYEGYFMKPSLVENMNLAKFSEHDVEILRSQEADVCSKRSPIELVFQGTVTVSFSELIYDTTRRTAIDVTRLGKITSMSWHYELKTFKEAVLLPAASSLADGLLG